VRLTLGSGRIYEVWGLVSGLVYGALGGLWAARGAIAAPIAVGLAFVLEPLIVWVLVRAGVWGGGGELDHRWMWVAEVLVGAVGIAVVVLARQPSTRSVG
jgi:hypothetical protein